MNLVRLTDDLAVIPANIVSVQRVRTGFYSVTVVGGKVFDFEYAGDLFDAIDFALINKVPALSLSGLASSIADAEPDDEPEAADSDNAEPDDEPEA